MTNEQISTAIGGVSLAIVLIYVIWVYVSYWRQRIKDNECQISTLQSFAERQAIKLQSKVDDLETKVDDLETKVDDLETKNAKRGRDEQYDKVRKLVHEAYPKFKIEWGVSDFWGGERRYEILNSEEVIFRGSLDDVETHCAEVCRYKRHKKQVKR